MQTKPLKLYWDSWGVGGGKQNGVVATTAAEAAATPYYAIWGPYNQSLDPWQTYSPEQASEVRAYRQYFFNQTISYANQTGVSSPGIVSWNVQFEHHSL